MSTIYSPDPHQVERTGWGQLSLGAARKFNTNDQGHALWASGMPSRYELARNGKIWSLANGNGSTFKANLTAIPAIATAATWFLFNDNATSTNVCLVPLWICAFLGSGVMGLGNALAVQIPIGEQTRFTADYAGVIRGGTTGKQGGGSNAYLGNAKTMIGAQAVWSIFPFTTGADTTIGSGVAIDPDGLFIVKPGHGMAVEVIGGAGTSPLFGVNIIYAEIPVDTL